MQIVTLESRPDNETFLTGIYAQKLSLKDDMKKVATLHEIQKEEWWKEKSTVNG